LRLQVTLRSALGSATLGERQHLGVECVNEALLIRADIRTTDFRDSIERR